MLGRYTTGPVAARPEDSRGALRLSATPTPILARPMPDRVIDLRCDTVTRPTAAMRRAMAEAEVGDDVFGDDPTVNALEERAAELLGKEAGLFVASGTMGNLVALMAHLARGQESSPAQSTTSSSTRRPATRSSSGRASGPSTDRPDGTLDPAAIDAAFRDPTDAHEPITGLVTLENTHAHSMGQPLTPAYTREVAAVARAPRRAAPHRRRAVLERRRRPARRGRDRARPGRAGRHGHVLPVQGPRLPGRVGRRRVEATFIWRARRARKLARAAGCARSASSPRPAWSRLRRSGRHDRPPGRRPRQRPPPGRGPRRHGRHRAARRHRAAGDPAASTPGAWPQTSCCSGSIATGARSSPRSRARNVLMVEYPHGQVRAVTHHDVTAADIDTTIARDCARPSPRPRRRHRHRSPSRWSHRLTRAARPRNRPVRPAGPTQPTRSEPR